jgi:hypothetical protein
MMKENINQNGQSVKPFNGARGIFIPYGLLDAVNGDYHAAAIISQLYYWSKAPGSENMWKYQKMKELAKQLRMKYRTFFDYVQRLKKAGIVVIEKHGTSRIVKLNKETLALLGIDEIAEIATNTTNSCRNCNKEVAEIATNSCETCNNIVAEFATNSCRNCNNDSPQPLEPQAKAKPLDYNEINSEIKNEIEKNKLLLSDDVNFSTFEKGTKLEGIISELKNVVTPNQSIPKEIEESLLTEMLRAGFPRKSLRSPLDRMNLHLLKAHFGNWESVIKVFQNIQKLRQKGSFLKWSWDRILRSADDLANYEPEPDFPVGRLSDIQLLRRYFCDVRPPREYVRRFVYRWQKYWQFVDMTQDALERLIQDILKTYYPDPQPQSDPLLEDAVREE